MAGLDPTNLVQPVQDQSQALENPYPQGYMTPAQTKAMYDYSQMLLKNATGTVPGTKGGWTVGLQHMVEALMGGQQAYAANKGELASRRYDASQQPQAPGTMASGGRVPPISSATSFSSEDLFKPLADNSEAAPSDTKSAPPEGAINLASTGGSDILDKAAAVTAKQESGGKYDNVTTTIGRDGKPQHALGKYGIMNVNVGPWTKEALGKEMSPQEFLNDPAAQDAVYKAKMGSYLDKYGPEGAGRAWIGGEGGVSHPDRADPLGTKVGKYGSDFARALAFNGQPAQAGSDAQSAIVSALAKGATPGTPPGVPAASSGDQIVAPFAVPQRPQVPREQYERLMGSPWQSEAQKNTIRDEYMQQRQPVGVPYLGGTAIVDPSNPNKQFFSPGVNWNEQKAGDSSTKVPQIIEPGKNGGPPTYKTLGKDGAAAGSSTAAPEVTPPNIGPGNGPAQATPPTVAPGTPAPAAPAVVPPRVEAPAPGVNPVVQAAAANQVASNAPMATAGAPPAPGPAETPADAVAKAQGALPPAGTPAAESAISPMGQKVAAALATQPPIAPAGAKTAEIPSELKELRDFSLEGKHREELNKDDVKNYTEAQKTYTQNGGPRALNAIGQLKLADKMVDDPRFYSGPLANFAEVVQKARAIVGKDPGMAAPMEIFNKIISGDVVQELKQQLGGLGQIRLAEINLINQSVANLYNTPAANKAVLNVMLRVNEQAVKNGEIARAYAAGWRWNDGGKPYRSNEVPTNAGLADAINKYTTNNPLFTDAEIANAQKTFKIEEASGKARPNPKYEPLGTTTSPSIITPASAGTPQTGAPPAPAGGSSVIRYDSDGKRIP